MAIDHLNYNSLTAQAQHIWWFRELSETACLISGVKSSNVENASFGVKIDIHRNGSIGYSKNGMRNTNAAICGFQIPKAPKTDDVS